MNSQSSKAGSLPSTTVSGLSMAEIGWCDEFCFLIYACFSFCTVSQYKKEILSINFIVNINIFFQEDWCEKESSNWYL